MSAAAVIFRRQNQMIRSYRDAGVTEPEVACVPEDLHLRRSWIFDRLWQRGVFVLVGDGRFFLDLDAAARFHQARRTRALLTVAIGILILLIILATG